MTSRALRRANDRRAAKESRSARRRALALGACATTLGAGAALGGAVVTASPAMAADYVVTNTDDSGSGSLRDALDAANVNGDADTITFAPGVTGTITLTSGLDVNSDATITGPGAANLTIDADGTDSALSVHTSDSGHYDVTISGLTITGGSTNNTGGGIYGSSVDLTLVDDVITGNSAGRGGGVGLYYSSATLTDVTISDNSAFAYGGGLLAVDQSDVTITGSTITGNQASDGAGLSLTRLDDTGALISDSQISGNTASNTGGGLQLYASSTATPTTFQVVLFNSTVSGNHADDTGGALVSDRDVPAPNQGVLLGLIDSTVADNSSPGVGGLAFEAGGAQIGGSVIAGNEDGDIGTTSDAPILIDHSLVQDPGATTYNEATPGSVLTGVDAQLGALADNGGPTQTMLPAATSPAIDAGFAYGVVADQRGLPRPVDQPTVPDATGSDGSDMGAVERQIPVTTPSAAGSGTAATPTCDGLPATIVAVPGVPTTGTPGPDVIVGTTGDDTITGADGNDLICGGTGNDTVRGGPGNDTLSGDTGDDTLKGNTGNDKLTGGDGNDKLSAGKGKDTLLGGPGNDTLKGKSGNDKLSGQAGKDKLRGGSGNDKGRGGPGRDHTHGGSGHDHLHPRTTA